MTYLLHFLVLAWLWMHRDQVGWPHTPVTSLVTYPPQRKQTTDKQTV